MNRTPVRGERPSCYSMFVGDDKCGDCASSDRCRVVTKKLRSISVVDDASPRQRKSVIYVEQMCDVILSEYHAVGGKARREAFLSKRWRATLSRIFSSCEAACIDAHLYIRAQMQTIGRWSVKNRRPLYANMLEGKNAQKRFEEWLHDNRKKYGDAHHLSSQDIDDRAKLLSAETSFVRVLIESSVPISEVSRKVKKDFPYWSITKGRSDRTLRCEAVANYLGTLDPSLPRRVAIHGNAWKWGTVRRELKRVLGFL